MADSIDDWVQGPTELTAEREAEDAWSTGTSISRHDQRSPRQAPSDPVSRASTPATESSPQAAPARPARNSFRSELHGLRAVALGLVAVYHVWLGRVSGGVDVFLFLSAFLLTGTFVRRLEGGRPLAIPRYWLHTFKRLLPPATVTVLGVLLATGVLLPQSLWPSVMRQAVASVTYTQNIELVRQSVDYTSRDAGAASPLQHFWSLAIQGQVFVVWPLLFLVAVPWARRHRGVRFPLVAVIALVGGFSLWWSITSTASNQPVAYFDTRARLWEFAAGSLLALLLPAWDRLTRSARPEDDQLPGWRKGRAVMGWIGISGLFSCGVLLNVSGSFPGWIALWPIISAALVVLAGFSATSWGVDRLLSTRPIAFIGDISYALYLVHWPILVFWLSHSQQERAGILDGFAVLSVSVLVAWVLTLAVDGPIRRSSWLEAKPVRALLAILASAALVIGSTGIWWLTLRVTAQPPEPEPTPGGETPSVPQEAPAEIYPLGWQLPEQWPSLTHECSGIWEPDGPFPDVPCEQLLPADAEAVATVVVIGSSHSRQYIPAFAEYAEEQNIQIVNLHKHGCDFSGPDQEYEFCTGYYDYVMDYLDKVDPSAVIMNVTRSDPESAREIVPAGLAEGVADIRERGITVVGFRDNPRWEEDQYQCAESVIDAGGDPRAADEQCGADQADKLAEVNPAVELFAADQGAGAEEMYEEASADQGALMVMDMNNLICPDSRCSPILGSTYVYMDDNHLTRLFVENELTEPVTEKLQDYDALLPATTS